MRLSTSVKIMIKLSQIHLPTSWFTRTRYLTYVYLLRLVIPTTNRTMYFVEFEFHKVWRCFKKTAHKFEEKKSRRTMKWTHLEWRKFLRINNRTKHIFWQMKTYCFLKLVKGLASWNNNSTSLSGVHLSCWRFLIFELHLEKKGFERCQNKYFNPWTRNLEFQEKDASNIWPLLTSL